jgi:hypothetical protein
MDRETNCADYLAEVSCVKNKDLKDCFWNSGKCWDKNCDNAPSSYKTD